MPPFPLLRRRRSDRSRRAHRAPDRPTNGLLPLVAWVGNFVVVALIGWFLVGYFEDADGLLDGRRSTIGRDFVVFWSAAVLTAGGQLGELYQPDVFAASLVRLIGFDAPPNYTYTHPPHMLFVLLPLAALPYLWALAAWSLAGVGAYLAAIRKPAALCAPATIVSLFMGQTGLLVGAAYVGALALLRRRPVAAGVCIGLVSVKPHLGVLIPVALVAVRAWRAFASATLTVLAVTAASMLAFGTESWRAWLFDALPHQASLMGGFNGPILVSAYSGAIGAGWPVQVAWLVQAPFTGFAVVATMWAFARLRRGQVSETTAGGVLLLSTVVAVPYVFTYDLTLATPVVLHALSAWRQRAERLRDLGEMLPWLGVWLLPLPMVASASGIPHGSVVLASALALLLWRAAGENPRSAAAGRMHRKSLCALAHPPKADPSTVSRPRPNRPSG